MCIRDSAGSFQTDLHAELVLQLGLDHVQMLLAQAADDLLMGCLLYTSRVDEGLMAVLCPAGASSIDFVYQAAGLSASGVVTAVAIPVWVVYVCLLYTSSPAAGDKGSLPGGGIHYAKVGHRQLGRAARQYALRDQPGPRRPRHDPVHPGRPGGKDAP